MGVNFSLLSRWIIFKFIPLYAILTKTLISYIVHVENLIVLFFTIIYIFVNLNVFVPNYRNYFMFELQRNRYMSTNLYFKIVCEFGIKINPNVSIPFEHELWLLFVPITCSFHNTWFSSEVLKFVLGPKFILIEFKCLDSLHLVSLIILYFFETKL